MALSAATDELHAAVDIFVFCVLISKDSPKRSQGSVTDCVPYISRTAIGVEQIVSQCYTDCPCWTSVNLVNINIRLLAVAVSRVLCVVLQY